MCAVADAVLIALLILVILKILRKAYGRIYSFLFAASSTIPSPPAYLLLRHLPYFWKKFQEIKVITEWAKLFKKEGIFLLEPLFGEHFYLDVGDKT